MEYLNHLQHYSSIYNREKLEDALYNDQLNHQKQVYDLVAHSDEQEQRISRQSRIIRLFLPLLPEINASGPFKFQDIVNMKKDYELSLAKIKEENDMNMQHLTQQLQQKIINDIELSEFLLISKITEFTTQNHHPDTFQSAPKWKLNILLLKLSQCVHNNFNVEQKFIHYKIDFNETLNNFNYINKLVYCAIGDTQSFFQRDEMGIILLNPQLFVNFINHHLQNESIYTVDSKSHKKKSSQKKIVTTPTKKRKSKINN